MTRCWPSRPARPAASGSSGTRSGAPSSPTCRAPCRAFFEAFCTLNGAIEAVIAGEERLTFAELDARSTGLARVLAGSWGVSKGDRVAIAMRNCPAWIVAYMAIVKAGGIATLINGWWHADEMRHGLTLAEPKLIITDAGAGRAAEGGRLHDPHRLAADRAAARRRARAPVRARRGWRICPRSCPEDDATILFTSGSTGLAKGAVSTHRAVITGIYAYSAGLAVLLGIKERDRRSAEAPAEDAGQRAALPRHRRGAGAAEQLRHRADDGADAEMGSGRGAAADRAGEDHLFRRRADDEPGADAASGPRQIRSLHPHRHRRRRGAAAGRSCEKAGGERSPVRSRRSATVSPRPMRSAAAISGPTITTSPPRPAGRRCRSSSSPSSATDDAHLPPGERGEIAIRSAANIRGYWRDEAATRAAFTADHYLRTGDIGYLDADGYLFIVDRKKDIIIRGGENISGAGGRGRDLSPIPPCPRRPCSASPTNGSARCRPR